MPVKTSVILLDQNIPHETTEWLRAKLPDAEVNHAFDLGLATWDDHAIFEFAQQRQALIITYDEDFADQRLFPVGSHFGIVRLRVEPTTSEETISALSRLFTLYEPVEIHGRLTIVQRSRIRIIPD